MRILSKLRTEPTKASHQESNQIKRIQDRQEELHLQNTPEARCCAESDSNFLCTNVTARSSLSSEPKDRRVVGAAEVSREGKGQ